MKAQSVRFVPYEQDGTIRHGLLDPTDTSSQTLRTLGDGDLLNLLEGDGITGAAQRAVGAPAVSVDEVTIVAPMGPWLVSADEVGDPQQHSLHLDVNGDVRQSGSTADMLFSVADLIGFSSRIMTLEPGDIMTARVGDLGEIRNPIVAPR